MSKTTIVIFCTVVAALVAAVAYRVLSVDQMLVPIPVTDTTIQNENVIANQWQWDKFISRKPASASAGDQTNKTEADKPRPSGEVPYDVVRIYNILQTIHLDDFGNVVPDHTAKKALDKGFDDLGPNLSAASMAELQELIRIGLPGAAGEEAALVMEQYYQFRLAEQEFNQQTNGQELVIDRYEELTQLRRDFLGDDIASQLFAVEDAQARHMLDIFALHQNEDLTEEEKLSQQEVLQDEFNDRLLALGQLQPEEAAEDKVRRLREQGATSEEIYSARETILGETRALELAAADREETQWQNNFTRFWQARQQVMRAGLDEAERERQINQLLDQYFSAEEQERARLTSFEWQAREQDSN